MQHYMHYGYGFHGELLTDEQYTQIVRHEEETDRGCVGIKFVSFTEDYAGKDWGTVILRDLGEAGIYGKLVTDFVAKQTEFGEISAKDRAKMEDVLARHGLDGKLIEHVQFIVYSENY